MFSTLRDVQYIGGYHKYIGGILWVHQEVLSMSGAYHEYIWDVQYIVGIP